MANLSDARILYKIWADHFDPSGTHDLGRTSNATQEAWLLVAAAARMLDAQPQPTALIIPGHLYMATWKESTSWQGDAPRRPKVAFLYPGEDKVFVIDEEPGHIPIIRSTPEIPELRRIPGMIYDDTPIKD